MLRRVLGAGVSVVVVASMAAASEPTGEADPTLDISLLPRTVDGYLFTPDGDDAGQIAEVSGEPVEVVSSRTPVSSTLVLPSGGTAVRMGLGDSWRLADGADPTLDASWMPIDASLVVRDGVIEASAVPGRVEVSAGGAGSPTAPLALATITWPDGSMTSFGWEGPLPDPQIDGNRAIYPDAGGHGVDVVAAAQASGGAEVYFVLRERPNGPVAFPLTVSSTYGVRDDGAGGLQLLAADGGVLGVVPQPVMWDAVADADRPEPVTEPSRSGRAPRASSVPVGWGGVNEKAVERIEKHAESKRASGRAQTRSAVEAAAASGLVEEFDATAFTARMHVATAAQARAGDKSAVARRVGEAPRTPEVESDQQVAVPMSVTSVASGVRVVLEPELGFLRDPATAYPVVVDPQAVYSQGPSYDTWAQTGTTTDQSLSTELRLGTYDGGAHVARSWVQFDTTSLKGRPIAGASLNLYEWHSWSCTARNWQIWHTGGINKDTRWTAQPGWSSHQATSSLTKGYSTSCNDGWDSVDVTGIVRSNAAASGAQITLGLRAENEADNYGWKRFYSSNNGSSQPYLWVQPTDQVPLKPAANPTTTPSIGCTTATPYPVINTSTPTIAFKTKDPDDATWIANIDIVDLATGGFAWDMTERPVLSNNVAYSRAVPSGKLVSGKSYELRTGGQDVDSGGFSPMTACRFTVDTTPPAAPTITSTTYPAMGLAGGPNVPGTFTFKLGADKDVDYILWSTDPKMAGAKTIDTPTQGGSYTATYVPPSAGLKTIYAKAVDTAKNQTATPSSYSFTVNAEIETAGYSFDGASFTDVSGNGALPLTLVPGTTAALAKAAGPQKDFGARSDDLALTLDGTEDYAQTPGPVVKTDGSYTVLAKVWLDQVPPAGKTYTAVAQDGVVAGTTPAATSASAFFLQATTSCTLPNHGPACWRFVVVGNSTAVVRARVESTVPVKAQRWVQLVASVNTTAGTATMWTCDIGTPTDRGDGVPQPVTPVTLTGAAFNAPGPLTVGRSLWSGAKADFFDGRIDDVRVYDGQVVSQARLRRICQGAEPVNYPGDVKTQFSQLDPTIADSATVTK